MEDSEIKIVLYYNYLQQKINFIETKNSFERFCLYKALELYGKNFGMIWCNKKRIRANIYSNRDYNICRKHNIKLSYRDGWIEPVWCKECKKYCQFRVEPNEVLY